MAVAGVYGLAWVVAGCFLAGFCGGVPSRVGMVCCLLPGFGGGELVFAWRAAVSRLRCVVASCFSADVFGGEPSRADVACWGGWGPHTPCARQIGPHPPQPTPPSRHGSLRCVWVRGQKCRLPLASRLHRFASIWTALLAGLLFSSSRVTPYSGAGAHGFARARGEPFRQSLLAVCGGRLTP